ncbi:hypothetical protein [uncultured Microbacterium sp.]|uniref:hypothetical protein n=1 Tax=uncultured Microbacterium sp. TaxID=191216 RepID=UPI0025F444E5|nr:hypothetical protein [uncultured Microbacterium sp.]
MQIYDGDGDGFDDSDGEFTLTTAGRYATVAKLPGADKDWTREADSVKVGDAATVTVWEKDDFSSLELACG